MQKKLFTCFSTLSLNKTDGLYRCSLKKLTKISMTTKTVKPSMGLRGFSSTKGRLAEDCDCETLPALTLLKRFVMSKAGLNSSLG
ncbi:MAG: hypothetical protein QW161_00135 [Candidatus Bathyarchaeia archaeon]